MGKIVFIISLFSLFFSNLSIFFLNIAILILSLVLKHMFLNLENRKIEESKQITDELEENHLSFTESHEYTPGILKRMQNLKQYSDDF